MKEFLLVLLAFVVVFSLPFLASAGWKMGRRGRPSGGDIPAQKAVRRVPLTTDVVRPKVSKGNYDRAKRRK